MTVGAIFGVLLGGAGWYQALVDQPLPSDIAELKRLLLELLIATMQGTLRAFSWLPSLIWHVGLQKTDFAVWLFNGWW